ncbi:MAG: DUF4105 domain-containing protein [Bacteroidaceae bacterium]|nr:DUF4105 domain-containing protein [Bacteroidaceae bacterium]
MIRFLRGLLLLILIASVTEAKAQRDSLCYSLLTCEPGRQIYELYGHTAIRQKDFRTGTDIVFNYGLFDFNTPHFIRRFTLGETDYVLGYSTFDSFSMEYLHRGSTVHEQVLNLTQDETERLRDLLLENLKPQNRTYRYNVLFNNCSTMAIDIIEKAVEGSVTYPHPAEGLTFRKLLEEKTSVRPWSRFAVNMVMGALTDLPLEYRQDAFSPMRLMNLAEKAVITDTHSVTRPLCLPATEIVRPGNGVDFGKPALTPVQVMFIILMVTIIISLTGWITGRILWFYDILLFGAQGIAGLVIATLYLFSEHASVDTNWLVICLNPLPLIFIPFAIHKIRKPRISILLVAEFLVCTSFIVFSGIIPQTFERAAMLLIAAFALRAFSVNIQIICRRVAPSDRRGSITRWLKRLTSSISLLFFTYTAHSQTVQTDSRPRLIVGIVIDQLDGYRLERMMPVLSDNGFRIFRDKGFCMTGATFDFDSPDRASAIASLYTGATPFQHGITSVRWMNRKSLMTAFSVDDDNYAGIGTIERSSPSRLLASNLADQMKLGSSGRSKVCSIAIERDAAILSAGHDADAAIWLSADNASWCSTDYYGNMPQWVSSGNDSTWNNPEWRALYSPSVYIQIPYGSMRLFSHTFRSRDIRDYRTSPLANDRVTELAVKAIDGMSMGSDDTPDLLMLTLFGGRFSGMPDAPDLSYENQDIYMRLDQNIATVIDMATKKAGTDNVLFFITSTGYEEPYLMTMDNSRIPSGKVSMERTCALLNLFLSAKYGGGSFIDTYYMNHIFLNHSIIEDKGLSMHDVLENSIDLLVQMSGVRNVVALRDLMSVLPDLESARKRNSFHKNCSGDLILETLPGWDVDDEKNGVTYRPRPVSGSFPIMLYGNGISAGISHEPVSASVLAPTITWLIGYPAPNAAISPPLKKIRQ